MIKTVNKGQTLLVLGPTRISLLEGELEVFGGIITPEAVEVEPDTSNSDQKNVLIIPSANRYPLHALEDSKIEIYTSKEENLKLIEKNSIPKEWIDIKDKIRDKIKKNDGKPPIKIMVLGISSGKTTFIKYLANCFTREGLKGAYLDSDLGQQIMYLPTTLNIGEINDFIISSEDIKTKQTVFIGATFPKGNYKFIVSHACNNLIQEHVKQHENTDFILCDTDGWIKTEAGVIYKNFFIKTIDPDDLIVFHDDSIEELKIIQDTSKSLKKDMKIHVIKDKNDYFFEKDKDERRFIRQSQFARVLEEYRKISISISKNDIKFVKADYDKETDEVIEIELNIEELISLPYHYVIVALLTEDSKILQIGLLFTINLEKDYVLLFSDLKFKDQMKVKKILLGSLRLSTKGNHQGYLYL